MPFVSMLALQGALEEDLLFARAGGSVLLRGEKTGMGLL